MEKKTAETLCSSHAISHTKEVDDDDDDPWKLKMVLTEPDLEKGRYYISLDNKQVEEHILKHWNDMMVKRATHDDIKLTVFDVDTNSQHQVNFRIYKHKQYPYAIQGHWRRNFVERRRLCSGDEIGFCFDPVLFALCFSLLKRAAG